MKYSTVLSLVALSLGVVAEPVAVDPPSKVRRDLATVTSVISSVQSGLAALDTSVKGFSGEAGPLISSVSSVVDTINSGTSTVSGSSDLSLTDALGLQTPVKDLQTVADSLSADLVSKKSAFESAGLCDSVETEATSLKTAADSLINAIVAKVPSSAQSIAQSLAAPLQADLAAAVAAFSNGNCTNSGGSSSTMGSSSAAASSTAASSVSSTSSASTGDSTLTSSMSTATSAPGAAAPTTSTGIASSIMSMGTGTGSVTPTTVPFTGSAANNGFSLFAVFAAAAGALLM